jgi:Cadherin domain.
VNEDALPGTVLLTLSISDADSDPAPSTFYITQGDTHAQFAIRSTGEVYVTRALDREAQDSYSLTVLVTDGKFVSTAQLDVDILDANGKLSNVQFGWYVDG